MVDPSSHVKIVSLLGVTKVRIVSWDCLNEMLHGLQNWQFIVSLKITVATYATPPVH